MHVLHVVSLTVSLCHQMLDDKGNTAVYLLYAYTRIRQVLMSLQVLLHGPPDHLAVTVMYTKYYVWTGRSYLKQ